MQEHEGMSATANQNSCLYRGPESVLIMLKVSGLKNVQRGRQVEIPFTAVEWAIPDGPSYDPVSIEDFENWGCSEG